MTEGIMNYERIIRKGKNQKNTNSLLLKYRLKESYKIMFTHKTTIPSAIRQLTD